MMHILQLARRASLLALLLTVFSAQAVGPTGLLNDTGQTQCDNGGNVLQACSNANTGDASAMPRQDGRFGRDVASPVKVGGGAAGFDFSKLCFNGHVQGAGTCTGTLVANTTGAATGSPSTDWACTKDNVTNLIWSLQSGFGDWTTYATATLPTTTNNAARCGHTDWRLPTRRELLSIVHNGTSSPAIDSAYFPDTQSSNGYWSADTYAPDPANGWSVVFSNGSANSGSKTVTNYVRLVANWTCLVNMNYSIQLGACQCNNLYVFQNGYCQLCPTGWPYTNGVCTCVKSKTNNCTVPQDALTAIATPASIAYNATSALSTTGGSGLGTVSYAVTAGGGFCSITGSTLTGTGVGSCTVRATKAAYSYYNAITATVSVTVTP